LSLIAVCALKSISFSLKFFKDDHFLTDDVTAHALLAFITRKVNVIIFPLLNSVANSHVGEFLSEEVVNFDVVVDMQIIRLTKITVL
jgi:hypothetical protein